MIRLAHLIKPFQLFADRVIELKRKLRNIVQVQLQLSSFKIVITFLLFLVVNVIAVAQQKDQQTTSTPATDKVQSEQNPLTAPEPQAENPASSTSLPSPLTQQYQQDLTHYLPAEQVKPLRVGTNDYITLVTENTSINDKGVAILLPDWQQSATNPKAINFLRKALPSQGWTTIAIQPPSMPENYPSKAIEVSEQQQQNDQILADYKLIFTAMMNATLEQTNRYPGIKVVIAQGHHGALLVEFFEQQAAKANPIMPNGVILLSSYLTTNEALIDEAHTDLAKKIAASNYPLLDLYLTFDHPIVLAKVKQRRALAKKAMKVYFRQRRLNSLAAGYYPEQALLRIINSWLKSIGW